MSYPDQPDGSVPILGPIPNSSKLEYRNILGNDGTLTGWHFSLLGDQRGKYFPRGCRGHITNIQLYCRDVGVAGGIIDVYISPIIGFGYTFHSTVVVPLGGVPAWRNALFNVPWNYDSLFVWFVARVVNLEVAYDVTFPYDAHITADTGITWTPEIRRYYIRIVYNAETCGDVPISGTINNIPLPNHVPDRVTSSVPLVPALGTLYTAPFYGAGHLLYLIYRVATAAAYAGMIPLLRLDGQDCFPIQGTFQNLWDLWLDDQDEGLSYTKHDAVNHQYAIAVKIHFPFKNRIEIGAQNSDPVNPHTVIYNYVCEVIS